MKILTRYLLRAHIGPFLFAFLALTGVVLINTLARRLADLAGKGLPMRVILEFFVLALPATVALTFPMAVLVSILYTFTHFTAENEITAMKASGLDLKRLLLPLLVVAAVLTGVMIWFNDRVLPEANHRWSQLFVDIARKTPTLILQAQTINRISPTTGGAQTYYLRAARVDPATNRLFDVSIYDVSNPSVLRTIYADSGRALFNATRTDLVMRLYDGHMREITMDDPATFRRMAFKEQVFGIPGVGTTLPTGERGNAFRGDREMTVGMLQERIDTLRKERSDLHRRMRNLMGADLDWALSGGTRAFRADGDTTTAPPPVVSPEESGVRVRTRRTADELESVRIRSAELSQQMREYEVEVHKKYSIAVASLVFVIVGAPLALRFGGGGIGMVIAASMIIFSLYYIGLIGGESLAGRGIVTPLVAMWVVNALMTVLGLMGLATMGRETSTARSGLWDNMMQGVRGFSGRVFRRGSRA